MSEGISGNNKYVASIYTPCASLPLICWSFLPVLSRDYLEIIMVCYDICCAGSAFDGSQVWGSQCLLRPLSEVWVQVYSLSQITPYNHRNHFNTTDKTGTEMDCIRLTIIAAHSIDPLSSGLSYCGLLIAYGVLKLCFHWFRQWLDACTVSIHYLNQWWLIVSWTLRHLNHSTSIFIKN